MPPFLGRVDADAAIAFARATNDPSELYDHGVVPPLFTAALIHGAFAVTSREMTEAVPTRGGTNSLHAEHDVHLLRPMVAGMAIQWEAAPFSVRQTPAGVMLVQRIVVSDAEGVPLVEHFWSSLTLGATVEAEQGDDRPTHTFPPDARQRPLGTGRVHVDPDQGFRYGGVSGDRIGHSLDDEVARGEGFPSKILQGLCTFALASVAVVDVAADRDPRRLRRFAGRFSAPAFPNRDLDVDVYDAGDGAVAFEARQDDVVVIKHGRAELAVD